MSTYAVLGATGSTGQSLVKILSQSPDNKINVYCRSKPKLLNLLPSISGNKKIKIYEGNLEDVTLITDCIKGTRAVFMAAAQSTNKPNCTIAIDSSRVVVSALENLRKTNAPNAQLPRLIVLSSSSIDPHLSRRIPTFIHWFLNCAVSGIYNDLRVGEEFLRSHDDWISCTFIKPGGLCQDSQKGHALSLDVANSPLSFMDLAAGMIEVANAKDAEEWHMKNVAVNPTSDNVAVPWNSVPILLKGLVVHFFPLLYPYFS